MPALYIAIMSVEGQWGPIALSSIRTHIMIIWAMFALASQILLEDQLWRHIAIGWFNEYKKGENEAMQKSPIRMKAMGTGESPESSPAFM